MNYKLGIVLWSILAISIIYWDIKKWEDNSPVSICHNAEIQVYYDKPMCTKCKLFCEVKK